MRCSALASIVLAALATAPAPSAMARSATVTGVLRAKGNRSHCSDFANAYWAFEVGDLPHLPCKPRLAGYLVTLNLWQSKRAPSPKGYSLKLFGVRFKPTLLLIPKDAQAYDVTIENQDRYKHHVFSPDAGRLGKELIPPNASRTVRFDQLSPLQDGQVQVFRMRCGYFPHIRGAVVFVRSTAYAKVRPRGRFRIRRVPTGEYVLRVWHWGKKIHQRKITVGRRGSTVKIDLLGKKAKGPRARPARPGARPPAEARKPAEPRPAKKKRRRRRRRRRR